MKIRECQELLSASLATTACAAPGTTCCGRAGQSILAMARAYENDGGTFLAQGDPVNALAAFLYGLGWLHCGAAAGLLVTGGNSLSCPFTGLPERVPDTQKGKLAEKTGRYEHLLAIAVDSVSPAPEHGTPAQAFALQVRFIAGLYLAQGSREASEGNREGGLACFSYGHGWLDAGVEAGFFSIHAHREIFTVD